MNSKDLKFHLDAYGDGWAPAFPSISRTGDADAERRIEHDGPLGMPTRLYLVARVLPVARSFYDEEATSDDIADIVRIAYDIADEILAHLRDDLRPLSDDEPNT